MEEPGQEEIFIVDNEILLIAVDIPPENRPHQDPRSNFPREISDSRMKQLEFQDQVLNFIREKLRATGLPVSDDSIYPAAQLGGGGAAGISATSLALKIISFAVKATIRLGTIVKASFDNRSRIITETQRPAVHVDVQILEGRSLNGTKQVLATLPGILGTYEDSFPGSRLIIRVFPRENDKITSNWVHTYTRDPGPWVKMVELEHESIKFREISRALRFIDRNVENDHWQYRARVSPNRLPIHTTRLKFFAKEVDTQSYLDFSYRQYLYDK